MLLKPGVLSKQNTATTAGRLRTIVYSLAGVVNPEVHILVPAKGPDEAEPAVANTLHHTRHALSAEAHELDIFYVDLPG